ncbi:MAG: BLUF domain-containing protein, partial [Flammeovirgaceae bacterium]
MLAQLVYISSRHKSCSTKQIAKILEASRPYNEKHQITGILLYSESSFLQVLEGDRLDILLLYDKIKKDSRHQKIA